MEALKRLGGALARFGRTLGHWQGTVLLTLLFLLVSWPLGILIRLKDPLRLRPGQPGWVPRRMSDPTPERFSHPF